MTETDNDKTPAQITVLRVIEGDAGSGPDNSPVRLFAVTLSRCAGEDLGVVATAVDPGKAEGERRKAEGGSEEGNGEAPQSAIRNPQSAICIPAPGEPHPTLAGFVARPPDIYCVGLRDKAGGAMLAAASNFYNVRVRYERKVASSREPVTTAVASSREPVAGGETERAAIGLASPLATGYGLPATKASKGSPT